MALGEYLGAGSSKTKGLFHLNGNANDSSGNGNNGTATNVSWVGGIIGSGSASFNGSSSYVNLGNTISLDTNIPFTIYAYIKTSTTGTYKTIISKSEGSLRYRGYTFGIIDAENTLFFDFYYDFSVNNWIGFKCAQNIVDGKWHQVGITYVGNNPNTLSSYNFYIDGKSVSFSQRNLYTISGSASNSVNTYIGARANGSFIHGMNGQIDEVIVENRVWSTTEIKKYYTYSKGRFGIL